MPTGAGRGSGYIFQSIASDYPIMANCLEMRLTRLREDERQCATPNTAREEAMRVNTESIDINPRFLPPQKGNFRVTLS
jgi:hypothetical protein